MNSNYLLLSSGPAGDFKYQFNTLQEAIDAGKDHLTRGNACSIYSKHSDLLLQDVTVVKSDIQLQADQAIIEANAIKLAGMEISKP